MQIIKNCSLKQFNTFGIDVTASSLVHVHSVENIITVLSDDYFKHQEKLILGGGSNILLTKNFEGVVLHNDLKGVEVIREDDNYVWIKAAAGEVWHEFVLWTINYGWGGIENLSLIPGSVGAGPMQNIGAYGVEIKNVFYELEALNLSTLKLEKFNNVECKFGYRESIFKNELKNKYFITSVTFQLQKNPLLNISYGAISQELERRHIKYPDVRDVSDAVIYIRQSKLPDPKVLGNAGSFFKNPEINLQQFHLLKEQFPNLVAYPVGDHSMKLAAGYLIEQCGWKGKQVGHTGSHKDQALVLVNYGDATGNEIYQLALDIRESVYQKFGVYINPEVNVV